MPSLAQAALAASIVISALGAIVICLLTAAFGFTPPGEEPPGTATRRLFLTRTGHAVAAACFAATAILLAIVLAQPVRAPVGSAADARLPDLATKLQTQIERLAGVEARMKDSERTLQRLESELGDVAAQRVVVEPAPAPAPASTPPAPERSVERPRAAAPPKRREASTREPATPAKPSPPPSASAKATVRAEPPQTSGPSSAASAPPPSAPAAAASAPSPTPPAAAVLPRPPGRPAGGPTADTGSSRDAEQPAASPAPAPSVSSRPRAASPSSPPGADFSSKLRDDWRTIRRGVETAGDDFRRAIDRLKQQLTD